jgi:UDP-2,4-diacetamido-2,4,6-trideoxy-beta-L-altropyranose hydrolase
MLSVRKARESDLQQFLDWRNDPAVVAASFTPGTISMSDHEPWFMRKLSSDDCSLYVIEHDSTPAGQVRFDIEGSRATINYSLDASFRGRHLATASVSMAIASFRTEHDEVTNLVAYVKPDNPASCRVFEKLDFEADGFDAKLQANRYHIDLPDWN